ncbi:MAG: hypothetical protein Q8K05_04055, partial [Polaromonas sp.]|uniref:hypothetical protein n=1 Tax=Polaromonas sp. TaxID=1869339 RepID=UPI002731BDA6
MNLPFVVIWRHASRCALKVVDMAAFKIPQPHCRKGWPKRRCAGSNAVNASQGLHPTPSARAVKLVVNSGFLRPAGHLKSGL